MAILEAMERMSRLTTAQILTPSDGIIIVTDHINLSIIALITRRQEITAQIGTRLITAILGILIGQTPTVLHTPARGIADYGVGGNQIMSLVTFTLLSVCFIVTRV